MNVDAEDVVFFDEALPDVEGAPDVGIAAFHVRGISDVVECLRVHGILEPA